VLSWERDLVILEDRHGKQRAFRLGAGFWYEGRPVVLKARRARSVPTRTASGSVGGPTGRARTALASRIYVEGRHDAELVEKIWGDDLRHVGVVVEYLGGIDDLPRIVADFAPGEGRRLGVLVDHLVPGSKESRIADRVRSRADRGHVLVLGHPYVDIWQAVKPATLGLAGWPEVPRSVPTPIGPCAEASFTCDRHFRSFAGSVKEGEHPFRRTINHDRPSRCWHVSLPHVGASPPPRHGPSCHDHHQHGFCSGWASRRCLACMPPGYVFRAD
jgi:hypothetical protein